MATVDKNFKVKNGLNVAGTATFGSNVVLGSTPLRFDTATNKLQLQINGTWVPIALSSEIPDLSNQVSFMDIGLAIDYNGQPIYTLQANGVTPEATSKFVDGGSPSSTDSDVSMVFDSGVIV
jgi:sulfur carrier protein ThiS